MPPFKVLREYDRFRLHDLVFVQVAEYIGDVVTGDNIRYRLAQVFALEPPSTSHSTSSSKGTSLEAKRARVVQVWHSTSKAESCHSCDGAYLQ